jgi:Holliday junction resolvase RusA-like endonuclease
MNYAEYQIKLPMPPSLNAAYMPVRRGRHAELIKTDAAREWENVDAGAAFRRQFPTGTPVILTGRLQVQYIYHFNNARDQDIFNREKLLSDFLQGKFFKNDSQIDVGVVYRRINRALTRSHVEVFIKEISDTRWVDMFEQEVGA